MWNLSCPDWETKIRAGRSLVPALPLFEDEAAMAVSFFNSLRLGNVQGQPVLRDAAGEWYRDIVRALFGSRDPATNMRHIREVFALVGKGNSKTSYSAGLMLVALLMNTRPRAEFMFIGPTQAISDLAYSHAVGMIEADEELKKRFHIRDHVKEIVDRLNKAKLKVKTFDLKILTGPAPVGVLLDELHLLGKSAATAKVLRQIRGGYEKSTEGFLVIITTQSDGEPAGAFKEELAMARSIRDGRVPGRSLPVLYEFPAEIAKNEALWRDSANWPMVMPNLGRSLHLESLRQDFATESDKGPHAARMWASQHLNIEIGVGLHENRWRGAEFWERQKDPGLAALRRPDRLADLLERCEVVCVGIDGGGLDDIFGLNVLGREREEVEVQVKRPDGTVSPQRMKRWLSWSHGWCHRSVLEVRKSIASRLQDFEKAGELTIVDDALDDINDIVDIIVSIRGAGLLGKVAVDPAGLGELADRLLALDITTENGLLMGVGQGYRLMNAIKTAERQLARGMLRHCGSSAMSWCVGNVKIEPLATAIRATKANAGDAKIDMWSALCNSVEAMGTNPELNTPAYQMLFV